MRKYREYKAKLDATRFGRKPCREMGEDQGEASPAATNRVLLSQSGTAGVAMPGRMWLQLRRRLFPSIGEIGD